MPLSVPNPAHGDWAQSDEWALSARISEPLRQITVETGLAGAAGFEPPHRRMKSTLTFSRSFLVRNRLTKAYDPFARRGDRNIICVNHALRRHHAFGGLPFGNGTAGTARRSDRSAEISRRPSDAQNMEKTCLGSPPGSRFTGNTQYGDLCLLLLIWVKPTSHWE